MRMRSVTPTRRLCRLHGGARVAGAFTLLALHAAPAHGQASDQDCRIELTGPDFTGAASDVSRLLDLLGSESRHSFAVRRISDRLAVDTCGVPRALGRLGRSLVTPQPTARGAVLLPTHLHIAANSGYPRDWNNGAQWGGRGFSASLLAGAVFRWKWFEAAAAPALTLQQNTRFTMQPYPDSAYSRYIDRWHGRFIDLPQRFGNAAYASLDAGQSYARVHVAGWRAGVSHENLRWGPARRNPLLLSGTAAGFPHVFIETSRPADVVLGTAELQLFWGRLSESNYFDYLPDNDHRALSGIIATLRPHGLEGLYLGVSRLHSQTWWPDATLHELLIRPYTGVARDSAGLPRDMRLYAIFMRWAAAPGGFEVYGEWARQDEWRQWIRLVNRVDAPEAYTVGLQKVVRRGNNAVRFSAEIAHLADDLPHAHVGRGRTTFYVSPRVVQGHTHRGQLLGAPIGPGSEAQFIGADFFWSAGRSSLSMERVRYDDDAYYAEWSDDFYTFQGYDAELSFRAGHLLAISRFAIEAEVGYSSRLNRDFLGLVPRESFVGFRRDVNYSLRLFGRWNPPRWSWER